MIKICLRQSNQLFKQKFDQAIDFETALHGVFEYTMIRIYFKFVCIYYAAIYKIHIMYNIACTNIFITYKPEAWL